MKVDIHPTYYPNAAITCSCGNVIKVGSTRENYTTELCSKCHPFYTGRQKTVDTAGRIEKFQSKIKMAEASQEKLKAKKVRGRKSMEEKVNEVLKEQVERDKKKEEKLMSKLKKPKSSEEASQEE